MEHIQTQNFIQSQIGEKDCVLEKEFPEIRRIADLVWEAQKIVFEVQCSGISKEEVENRSRDYRKLGYEIVWILHQKTFNRFRLSAAEEFLQDQPHYYTNLDAFGRGSIYDQIRTKVRPFRKKIWGIRLSELKKFDHLQPKEYARLKAYPLLEQRKSNQNIYFGKDFVDRAISLDSIFNELDFRKERKKSPFQFLKIFIRFFMRLYLIFFRSFIEKACKRV